MTKGFAYIYNNIDEIIAQYKIPNPEIKNSEWYHQKTGKGTQIVKCPICKKTSSLDKWTVCHNVRMPDSLYIQIIKSIGEGVGLRSIGRIFEINKNTVGRLIERTGEHCARLNNCFLRNLTVEECQLDEMWSFIYKKEKNLTEFEKLQSEYGDTWIWIAFDPVNKILIADEMGSRTQLKAYELLKNVKTRIKQGMIPFFTSDNLNYYENAILYFYGESLKSGKNIIIKPKPELDYAKVCKKYENSRVVEIEISVCFGDQKRILKRLENSPVSKHVNVAFVERQNLTRRLNNRRLTRKTLGFSKTFKQHKNAFEIEKALYHFCKPHKSLTIKSKYGGIIKQTPFMAAGITDHIWSVDELLHFVTPR